MKWFRALGSLPGLIAGVTSAIEAYDTHKSFAERSLAVEISAQALREIVAQFYTKTPTSQEVTLIVARVMGALETTS